MSIKSIIYFTIEVFISVSSHEDAGKKELFCL